MEGYPQQDDLPSPARSADDLRRPPSLLWLVGAVGAVLMHAGFAALAYDYLQIEAADADLGAPAIEIAVELAAPQHDPTDLPPGPDADASAASPAIAEQKTSVEETDLPKAQPTETDDPDRLVTPQEVKKPEDDEPKTQTIQTAASEASVAAEATAMPSPPSAQESLRSTAPELGIGESLRRVRATWQKELAVHLDRHKRYPPDRSNQSAEIVVRFELDRTGHVVSAEIQKSSGDAAFDQAALTMMRSSDPVPAPPPLVADAGLTFSLPVIFRVKSRS